MAGRVYIGTSGWHYKHWCGVFYPENLPVKQQFSFYAQYFDTVELNNSFYRLPSDSTFLAWRENSPPNFLYAVKASRFITHMKKLQDPINSTARFFHGAELLAEKLGPILFQLPPRWKRNLQRLDEFLEALPKNHQYVFEFRDESWLVPEVYRVLRHHNAAFCIHDLASMQMPLEITADFTYLRFHGPGEAKYSGSYPTGSLREWASRIKSWRKDLSSVYAYCNNDVGGQANRNALTLIELVNGN